MLYTGVDIVEIARIERAVQRWGARFLGRVYTDAETRAYGSRVSSLAARWAAKEATGKLLGVGLRGIGAHSSGLALTEIEVLSSADGRPLLTLYGAARARAAVLGFGEIAISLSHSRDHAIAFVVASGHAAAAE